MILTLFPIISLGVCQTLTALLLLAPLPISRPAVNLCKSSKTPVGQTFLGTVTLVLLILLVPSVLEIQDLRSQSVKRYAAGSSSIELDNLHRRDAETLAWLSAILTAFCLLMNFVLQKLGVVLGKMELAQLKEATLLKQVKGLHAEYDRLSSQQSNSAKETSDSGSRDAQSALAAANRQIEELRDKVSAAEKRQKNAELNLDALKTQTRGLENEYDRLLALHDELQRKLSRSDPNSSGHAPQWKSKKDG